MIAGRLQKHLRFMHQAAERFAVQNAIAVALEAGSDFVFFFRAQSALALGSFCGAGRKARELLALHSLADRLFHRLLLYRKRSVFLPCNGCGNLSARNVCDAR